MCIYCGTNKYRKIYESHFGPIPKDDHGRKYEIHHIDGDRNNNDLTNLKCVSIQEHYDIHLKQGDWAACYLIGIRIKLSPDEISKLSQQVQLKRIADGNHPFLDIDAKKLRVRQRVLDGTHNFLGEKNPVHKLVSEGIHHLQGGEIQRRNNKLRIQNGTHNFLDSNFQRTVAISRINNGTHNFITCHPTKTLVECPHCQKVGPRPQMKRWHMDNCKHKL